ncbi:AAA family ATPase [Roseiterribacter gracilis]|uniref:ATPase AAA-type core domain-containing protein n=1 Tax=Roseiterribacter gracilis TaxID=2812848 RepID=A0A8S8XB16_9PROT|nr:hypothetical protein TMPK1_14590 [Rhodospirillales bacterium TMPK1]
MASPQSDIDAEGAALQPVRLHRFAIDGLFGRSPIAIDFPPAAELASEPSILILSGQNGSGKTTILKMLAGATSMNFDTFRAVPFRNAILEFSNGEVLQVERTSNEDRPLRISFGGKEAFLAKDKRQPNVYSPREQLAIDAVREQTKRVLKHISFQFLDTTRSTFDQRETFDIDSVVQVSPGRYSVKHQGRGKELEPLADKVREFMREAQVNYRKFFQAENLELLPRILQRFKTDKVVAKPEQLLSRVKAIAARIPEMKRLGLQTDDVDIETLTDLLISGEFTSDEHSLALLETYVETQTNKQSSRELIAHRLLEFEKIMDEFLVAKTVRVDARLGLKIETDQLQNLRESELSSGEYHFLLMMVAALLCRRSGSIIAIDEPELSLHVGWQRKVVGALARCAAGASPLFIFATHSMAISAEHRDRTKSLSAID